MEPKFINKCTQTEKNLREMMFAAQGGIRKILYPVVAGFAILTAILMFSSGVIDSGIILAMMGVLLLLIAYVNPFLAARQQVKRNQLLTGGNGFEATELRFYEDRVVTQNPTVEKELTFTYDQFKKLRKTKHLYLLALPQRLYVLIERGCFTLGDESEFEKFIKEKIKK